MQQITEQQILPLASAVKQPKNLLKNALTVSILLGLYSIENADTRKKSAEKIFSAP